MLPSANASSTPVTVTVCGMFQFAGVKVKLAGATVPSVVSLDDNGIVTFAVGAVSSLTVNDAVAPVSLVNSPDVGVTVMPGVVKKTFSVGRELSIRMSDDPKNQP